MRCLSALTGTIVLVMSAVAGAEVPSQQGIIGLSQVSYSLPTGDGPVGRDLAFQSNVNRDLPFAMGRPEGAEATAPRVQRAAPRATVRLAQSRAKRTFRMPWQTGVFQ